LAIDINQYVPDLFSAILNISYYNDDDDVLPALKAMMNENTTPPEIREQVYKVLFSKIKNAIYSSEPIEYLENLLKITGYMMTDASVCQDEYNEALHAAIMRQNLYILRLLIAFGSQNLNNMKRYEEYFVIMLYSFANDQQELEKEITTFNANDENIQNIIENSVIENEPQSAFNWHRFDVNVFASLCHAMSKLTFDIAKHTDQILKILIWAAIEHETFLSSVLSNLIFIRLELSHSNIQEIVERAVEQALLRNFIAASNLLSAISSLKYNLDPFQSEILQIISVFSLIPDESDHALFCTCLPEGFDYDECAVELSAILEKWTPQHCILILKQITSFKYTHLDIKKITNLINSILINSLKDDKENLIREILSLVAQHSSQSFFDKWLTALIENPIFNDYLTNILNLSESLNTIPRLTPLVNAEQFTCILINRNTSIFDQMHNYLKKVENFKSFNEQRLKIEFVNEPGVDTGGLIKEVFTLLCQELKDPTRKLFQLVTACNSSPYRPNPHATSLDELSNYRSVGLLMAIALLHNVPFDLPLGNFFYKKLFGYETDIADLKSLDEQLYYNLVSLQENSNVADLCLSFSASVSASPTCSAMVHIDLVKNGSEIVVTRENVADFIRLRTEFPLEKQIRRQFKAIQMGFKSILPLWSIPKMEERDFDVFVCGQSTTDIEILKLNTDYVNFEDAADPLIQWFWDIMNEMDEHYKCATIQFWSGSKRIQVIVNGKRLEYAKYEIHLLDDCISALPQASTCFNILKLRRYASKEVLLAKLMKALEAMEDGFTLA
jgi:hypothetical protein